MNKNATIWTVIIVIVVIIVGVIVYMTSSKDQAMPAVAPQATTITSDQGDVMPAPSDTTDMGTATSSMTATTSPVSSTAKGSVVLTAQADPKLGTYLVASNGMTLYTSTKDSAGVSTCTGACATAWMPYTVDASVVSFAGGTGVKGAISAITRADGTKQVTYNGLPLYFWQGDKKSGDTTGNGVGGFGIVRE